MPKRKHIKKDAYKVTRKANKNG